MYSGNGVYENPMNPGNNNNAATPPLTFLQYGRDNVNDAATKCANSAWGVGYASFDLHFNSTSNYWMCVAYPMPQNDASNFNMVDPTISAVYGYSLPMSATGPSSVTSYTTATSYVVATTPTLITYSATSYGQTATVILALPSATNYDVAGTQYWTSTATSTSTIATPTGGTDGTVAIFAPYAAYTTVFGGYSGTATSYSTVAPPSDTAATATVLQYLPTATGLVQSTQYYTGVSTYTSIIASPTGGTDGTAIVVAPYSSYSTVFGGYISGNATSFSTAYSSGDMAVSYTHLTLPTKRIV